MTLELYTGLDPNRCCLPRWDSLYAAGTPSALEGQAFCFLPLPARTGLPLHINAFFELSSNRRDIWYAPDLTGTSQLRGDWNISLLEVEPLSVVCLVD